jgi:protoporphyrin/coproporphyrin ferrochelatase
MRPPDARPYEALLLVSFGGPEGPDDVIPFLENVTRGRGIPRERLAQVGEHYSLFGGRSPINDQNRALLAALREDFSASGLDLPVYWGNRNWEPYLAETLARMRDDGVTRAACFVTAAYSSYSSCRQYRENLAEAEAAVPEAPVLDKLRVYFNHPGFVEPVVDAVLTALAGLPGTARETARLVFVTHSIPEAMNAASGPSGGAYERQHRSVAFEVADRVRLEIGRRLEHDLVYCSRSGSPETPWLEPDVNDHLEKVAAEGTVGVVLIPVGFVSDQMEVIYDLDTEAAATAAAAGLSLVRAATAGIDPRFVAMIRDLVLERAAAERGEAASRKFCGDLGAFHDRCPTDCCANPRGERAAIGGLDG